MNTKKYRFLVNKSFWIGCGLGFVLIVAAVSWATFENLGDEAVADGLKGFTVVAFVCWVLNFLFLVSVLALTEMSRVDKENTDPELRDIESEL